MIDQIEEALTLAQQDRSQVMRIATLAKSIPAFDDQEVDQLLDRLLDFSDELRSSPPTDGSFAMDQLIQPLVNQLVQREVNGRSSTNRSEFDCTDRVIHIVRLYRLTHPQSDLRNHLLRWLATMGTEPALQAWCELICNEPPEHRTSIMLAFSPVMQSDFQPPEWLPGTLLQRATTHSQIAPAVYDLLNYYYREKIVDHHPAADRVQPLAVLLEQMTVELAKIESGNLPENASVSQVNQLVSDSVALMVSLCDTFALVNYRAAQPVLRQALELSHRRVQTEAAAALARMGDDEGKAALVRLANQPIARLRVLAYAEELGFRDEISLELQGEIAIAESHLAIWLAEPAQMGLAPSRIEFLDSQEIYWPGYEHPVQCYLFRYEYGSGPQTHSNIGICGPMTHAFPADLQHLPTELVYAAFAGWQTVHDEIFQVPIARAQSLFPNQWRSLCGDLNAEAFDQAEPKMAASFFGQLVMIADVQRDGQQGTAILDGQGMEWFEIGNPQAPIDWQMAYTIWRGHQLLKGFNPQDTR